MSSLIIRLGAVLGLTVLGALALAYVFYHSEQRKEVARGTSTVPQITLERADGGNPYGDCRGPRCLYPSGLLSRGDGGGLPRHPSAW